MLRLDAMLSVGTPDLYSFSSSSSSSLTPCATVFGSRMPGASCSASGMRPRLSAVTGQGPLLFCSSSSSSSPSPDIDERAPPPPLLEGGKPIEPASLRALPLTRELELVRSGGAI